MGVVPLLGSVPAYYREVYEAICCRTDERVQVEVFQRLLQRTDLSKAVLGQVRASYFTVLRGTNPSRQEFINGLIQMSFVM